MPTCNADSKGKKHSSNVVARSESFFPGDELAVVSTTIALALVFITALKSAAWPHCSSEAPSCNTSSNCGCVCSNIHQISYCGCVCSNFSWHDKRSSHGRPNKKVVTVDYYWTQLKSKDSCHLLPPCCLLLRPCHQFAKLSSASRTACQ